MKMINVTPSTPTTCLELNSDFHGGVKTPDGEVYRDGPYVTRVEIRFWSPSPEALPDFVRYLVRAMHYQQHGTFDDFPGSFQGHVVVQDPFFHGEFPTGWYSIHMWVKDNLLFHVGEDEPASNATWMLRGLAEEALWQHHCLNDDSQFGTADAYELVNGWVSYRTAFAVTGGIPVGMHARFAGPNLCVVEGVGATPRGWC